jgi:hypothetical protein
MILQQAHRNFGNVLEDPQAISGNTCNVYDANTALNRQRPLSPCPFDDHVYHLDRLATRNGIAVAEPQPRSVGTKPSLVCMFLTEG